MLPGPRRASSDSSFAGAANLCLMAEFLRVSTRCHAVRTGAEPAPEGRDDLLTPTYRMANNTAITSGAGPVRLPAPAAAPRQTDEAPEPLYTLHPKLIWRFVLTQPLYFWCINAYLLFEYVRPQSIYPAIAGPPWAQMTILASLGTFLLAGRMFTPRTVADIALMVFSAVLILSCFLAYFPDISFEFLPDYITWVLIVLLISNSVTTERRFLVFMLAYLLYNLKMSQHATLSWASAGFAFRDWGVAGAPGWFHNSGEFGIQMNVFLPIAICFVLALRDHWGKLLRWASYGAVVTIVAGTVGSSSRGAMLGMVAASLFLAARSKHKAKAAVALVVMGAFAFFLLPEESMDRFRSMGEDGTSTSRRVYWAAGIQALNENPITGIGFANWSAYMHPRYEDMGLPHNIFVQAGAELGYLGLAALAGLIIAHFVVNAQTRRILRRIKKRGNFLSLMSIGLDGALFGFLVSGSFVTVLYYPYLWINLAMTVALYNAARHTVRQERKAAQQREAMRSRIPHPFARPA